MEDSLVVDLSGCACTSICDDLRPDLVELCLMYNRIERIEKLEPLAALQKLSLRANRIAELRGLRNCRALRELELYENQLKRLEGLEGLDRLEVRHCPGTLGRCSRAARTPSICTDLRMERKDVIPKQIAARCP